MKAPFRVYQAYTLEECVKIDLENYQETLNILNDRDLHELIVYRNSSGNQLKSAILYFLIHVMNHFSNHKRQIISGIRQIEANPTLFDYVFYEKEEL